MQEQYKQEINALIRLLDETVSYAANYLYKKIEIPTDFIKELIELKSEFSQLIKENNDINETAVKACKDKLKSQVVSQIFDMKTDLLKKTRELKKQLAEGFYRDKIESFLTKIPLLQEKFSEDEFYGQRLNTFLHHHGAYCAYYQKLIGKIEKAKNKAKGEKVEVVTSDVTVEIKNESSLQKDTDQKTEAESKKPNALEKKPNYSNIFEAPKRSPEEIKIQKDFQILIQQQEAVLNYLKNSPFLEMPIGKQVNELLQTNLERLKDPSIEVNKTRLNHEKQNVTSYFKMRTEEFKSDLEEWMAKLATFSDRGFHSNEMTKWVSDVTAFLKKEA